MHALPENQAVGFELRPLGVHYVAQLAPVVRDPPLLALVEVVEAPGQRLPQCGDIAVRMQCCPWPHAALAFARFEDEQERIQPRCNSLERMSEQERLCFFCGLLVFSQEIV